MCTVFTKISNILTKKILDKYKPVVICIVDSSKESNTKETMCKILEKKYKILCSQSDCTADINVPPVAGSNGKKKLSFLKKLKIFAKSLKIILKKTEYYDILVFEIDSYKLNNTKRILKTIKPRIGIIVEEKKNILEKKHPNNTPNPLDKKKYVFAKSLGKKDLAILNYDNKSNKKLLKYVKAKIITYGFHQGSNIKGEIVLTNGKKSDVGYKSKEETSFKISYNGTTVPFRFSHKLDHSQIYAILSAVSVGIHFGFNLVEMSEIISDKNRDYKCAVVKNTS